MICVTFELTQHSQLTCNHKTILCPIQLGHPAKAMF